LWAVRFTFPLRLPRNRPAPTVAWVASDGRLTVRTPTQTVFLARNRYADAVGLPVSAVRVIQSAVGGGFGGKTIEECNSLICAWVATRVGRPVRFVGAETEEDDNFALSRLRQAFAEAGFDRVDFELEPIAAAYAYESTLDHDELILIGDFGGGTSDFSLVHVGPGVRKRGRKPQDLLGNTGVGLAGDAFDARIVRKLVSPALGSDSFARSLHKVLPAVPAWIYANLERWHYLSFLRTANVMEILKTARLRALEPEKIEALITLIDEDLGYHLHQAVQRVKFELSHADQAEFHFRDGSMDISMAVTRAAFEGWIAEELHAIEQCIDSLLETSGITQREVDRVFLTGGTSLVPAVRRIFEQRFGEDRIRTGNEFISVARGLALRAEEALA